MDNFDKLVAYSVCSIYMTFFWRRFSMSIVYVLKLGINIEKSIIETSTSCLILCEQITEC